MKKKRVPPIPNTCCNTSNQICINPCCFFCSMKEPDASERRAGIVACFREMPDGDTHEHVLVLSGLWHIAMSQPNDPEFPSLGVFKCMASLIHKGISDTHWLLTNQNIYIPYYAAHIIGSYTMNKEEFAQLAVQSGVVPPLVDLLRGKISWVEQRVAVRALGHLASYKSTFESVAYHEQEVVNLALNLASTCLEIVYVDFIAVKENKRVEYHRNLITRGVGDLEMENRKAEEWASQLQCWSLYLLNCFACKDRSLDLICKKVFLKDLCDIWGGFINHTSPGGVGLIRILCYSKVGRKNISELPKVVNTLGNLSRSSDDWQYIGIDCLLLLLKDPDTRYKVLDVAASYLIDLIELTSLGDKSNVGDTIIRVLLSVKPNRQKVGAAMLQEVVDRRNKEKLLSEEKVEETRVLVGLIKQQGNHMFRLGKVEEALLKYSEALGVCPLRFRKERMVIYSSQAQCHILLKNADSAISDSTRALCLSNPANTHGKSLWRRSQAYDMKGMAKESLMDCIMFINSCIKSGDSMRVKIPYHAARMISKHMDATWLFATARLKVEQIQELNHEEQPRDHKIMVETRNRLIHGLSTIIEEPFHAKEADRRKMERARRRFKKGVVARST
uniref:Protein unc-45 homolog B n=2 Tax=Cajanus cajan TaxID=3821 RepID=A0A151TTX7_CAJCA|nr:Tetratricopeptide repeat protein 1 [Cajanus cajan]